MTEYTDTISLGIGVAEATPAGNGTILRDYPGIAQTDAVGWVLGQVLSEILRNVDEAIPTQGYPAVAADTIGSSDAPVVGYGLTQEDLLAFAQTDAVGWVLGEALIDYPALSDSATMAQIMVLAETIGIAPALAVVQAITVLEGLGVAPGTIASLVIHLAQSDGVGLADSLRNFFGGDLAETVGMATVLLGSAQMPGALSETVGVAQSETPSLIIRVTAADSVAIDDDQILNMLFAPTLAEGIEISAAYLNPGESFTAWAMNTRTGAVTEYSNFVFNSFGKIGNTYLAASADGLFALSGDNDAGTSIIARLKSGFAQFTGGKFTLLKGIYLAVRGEGNFVLKVITGDDKTYTYAVATRDQRTTKVHVGKGLRARYFAFELISTGQDFDLDTLEFVPIGAKRHV